MAPTRLRFPFLCHVFLGTELHSIPVLQVATGLETRIEAPTEAKPSRMLHIRKYLAVAVKEKTLQRRSLVSWSTDSLLLQLVAIGLACCAAVEERLELRNARAQLAVLWEEILPDSSARGQTVRLL